MKKILSLMLSLIIIVSVCSVGTHAEDANTYGKHEQYCYDTLVALEIIDDGEDLRSRITKGQFCDIVARMLKIDGKYYEDKLYFRDVAPDHLYYDSISILASEGYLFGNDLKRVYPDEYISKNTALVILVRALGYELMAQQSGGYIVGYESVWNSLNLDEGLRNIDDEDFTLAKVAVMLYNTLLAKQVGFKHGTTGSSLTFEGGNSILYSLYNGYEFRGVVSKNEFTSINSADRFKDERIRIDNIEMSIAAPGIEDYLGYEVKGIMTESKKGEEDYTLISFTDYEYNDDLIIRSTDVLSVPDTLTVKYDDGESKKTRVAELTRNVSVIYNYQYLSTYTKEDLDIDSGYLKLIDNNLDGKYDVVFVYEYKTYFVSNVDSFSKLIYDSYGYSPLEIDDETIIMNSAGIKLDISAIQSKNILSVYEPKNASDTALTIIEQSMIAPVVGKVDKTFEDEGTFAEVGGKTYKVSDRYATISSANTTYKKIKLGLKGTFFINEDMEICAFEASSDDFTYAYLINLWVKDDEVSKCKIYTQYAVFEEHSFHENLKINGKRVDDIYKLNQNTLLYKNGKTVAQLIKYKANTDGLITEMLVSDGTKVSPMKYKDNMVNYNGQVSNAEIRGGSAKKYNYQYLYDDDTVIFIIPENLKSEKDYNISNKIFSDGQKLTMDVYDVDNSYLMKAAIINGGKASVDFAAESYLVVVTDTGIESINENDELTEVIKGYYKGQEYKYESLEEDDWFNGFKEGDIVHILKDSVTGKIMGTKKFFTFDNAPQKPTTDAIIYHDEYTKKMPHDSNPIPSRLYGATGMVYGNCIAKGNNYVTLSTDGGETGDPFSTVNDTLVYVVEKKDGKITVAPSSMDAIIVATQPSIGNGSKVLLNTRNAIVREIFIIKE